MNSEQIGQALRNAAAAGDEAAARRLAQAYREAQQAEAGGGGLLDRARQGIEDLGERGMAATAGFVEGVPIVGPALAAGAQKAAAGIASALPGGGSYEDELATIQGERERLREAHPAVDMGSQVAGGMAMLSPVMKAAPAAFGLTQASPVARVGASAASGAALGAADTAARGGDARAGAILGGAAGAAAPAIGGAVGKLWQTWRGPKAPTVAELSSRASDLYNRARQSGVQINDQGWMRGLGRISRAASDAGINRHLHPKAMGVLQDMLKTRGQGLSLDDAEQWRRILKGVAKSTDPDERRIGKLLVDQFDGWQGSLKSGDVLAGDPNKAVGYLREARELWTRTKKGELIGDMIENAELGRSKYTQSGVENALRAEFRKLSKNPNKMRWFSKEERAAIKDVANGGPVRNALQWLGKFAPSGTVSFATGAGTGAAVGALAGLDPVATGTAVAGLGIVGKRAATAGTKMAAREAQNTMLRGAPLPRAASPTAQAATLAGGLQMSRDEALQREIARRLMAQ